MRENLEYIMKTTTAFEGGYVNNKNDRGGPTNHGITQATLSAFRGRPVTIADVKNLTKNEAIDILRRGYYDKVWGDKLPSGLDLSMTDYATNSGPGRANKSLQKVLKVAQDGVMGELTLGAIKKWDLRDLIIALNDERMSFLRSLKGKKGFPTFGRGWTVRVTGKDPKGQWKDAPGIVGLSLAMVTKTEKQISTARATGTPLVMPAGGLVTEPKDLMDVINIKLPDIDFKMPDLSKIPDIVKRAGKSSDEDRGFTSTTTGKTITYAAGAGVLSVVAGMLPAILGGISYTAGNSDTLIEILRPIEGWSPWVSYLIQILSVLGTLYGMFLNRDKERSSGARW